MNSFVAEVLGSATSHCKSGYEWNPLRRWLKSPCQNYVVVFREWLVSTDYGLGNHLHILYVGAQPMVSCDSSHCTVKKRQKTYFYVQQTLNAPHELIVLLPIQRNMNVETSSLYRLQPQRTSYKANTWLNELLEYLPLNASLGVRLWPRVVLLPSDIGKHKAKNTSNSSATRLELQLWLHVETTMLSEHYWTFSSPKNEYNEKIPSGRT